jgi:hypothetical protein
LYIYGKECTGKSYLAKYIKENTKNVFHIVFTEDIDIKRILQSFKEVKNKTAGFIYVIPLVYEKITKLSMLIKILKTINKTINILIIVDAYYDKDEVSLQRLNDIELIQLIKNIWIVHFFIY